MSSLEWAAQIQCVLFKALVVVSAWSMERSRQDEGCTAGVCFLKRLGGEDGDRPFIQVGDRFCLRR